MITFTVATCDGRRPWQVHAAAAMAGVVLLWSPNPIYLFERKPNRNCLCYNWDVFVCNLRGQSANGPCFCPQILLQNSANCSFAWSGSAKILLGLTLVWFEINFYPFKILEARMVSWCGVKSWIYNCTYQGSNPDAYDYYVNVNELLI